MFKPLFLTGTARGGTNLVKWILEQSDKVVLESEPFLPIYISFRNAALKNFLKVKKIKFNFSSPLDDYYYEEKKIAMMYEIQKTKIKLKYIPNNNKNFKKKLSNRMRDYVPYLIKYTQKFNKNNYKKMFDTALEVVQKYNSDINPTYVGWLDNWIIEFFPHLAKSYKKAFFIVIFRDVRASIASTLKRKDALNAPSILSFIRCWRKQIAFSILLKKNKLFKNRILFVKYEDLVREPENSIKKICKKMKIRYFPEMIDVNKFRPLGLNKSWKSNSNYNVKKNYIYKTSINKWKKSLSKNMISFVELASGNDLNYLGYKLENPKSFEKINKKKVLFIRKEIKKRLGWSTDNFSISQNIKFEVLRNYYIKKKIRNKKIINKFFLNKEIYKELSNKKKFFN